MPTLKDIYADFQACATSMDKVEHLKWLQTLDLPYDLNYENLIAYWRTAT